MVAHCADGGAQSAYAAPRCTATVRHECSRTIDDDRRRRSDPYERRRRWRCCGDGLLAVRAAAAAAARRLSLCYGLRRLNRSTRAPPTKPL
jgi:hypothetical protein